MAEKEKTGLGCLQIAILVLGGCFSLLFLILGFLWIIAASHPGAPTETRLGTGVVLIFVGFVFMAITIGISIFIYRRLHPVEKKVEITQKVDLSGDVKIEEMKCKKCGAQLSKDSVVLREGAIFVSCPYCGSDYEVEEAPKW